MGLAVVEDLCVATCAVGSRSGVALGKPQQVLVASYKMCVCAYMYIHAYTFIYIHMYV